MKRGPHPLVIASAQLLIYPWLMLLRLMFVHRLERPRITRQPRVIYANHQSRLDPLLLPVVLPPATVIRLLPFRFMATNRYFDNPLANWPLRLMGGFPAYPRGEEPYGLDLALKLMASGQTLVMFPQGRRTRDRIARPGIAALAREGTTLLPMKIDWSRRGVGVFKVGQAFAATGRQSAEELMERIYRL